LFTVDLQVTFTDGSKKMFFRLLSPHDAEWHIEHLFTDGSKKMFYMPLRIMRGEKPEEQGTNQVVKSDWPWVNPTYTLEIDAPASQIERLEIDPSMRMADINRDNNVVIMGERMQATE